MTAKRCYNKDVGRERDVEYADNWLEGAVREGEKDENKGTRQNHIWIFFHSNWCGHFCHSVLSSVL